MRVLSSEGRVTKAGLVRRYSMLCIARMSIYYMLLQRMAVYLMGKISCISTEAAELPGELGASL